MVSSPKVGTAIDQTLTEVSAALSDLKSILEDQQRAALPEHERVTLSLEWDREMHHLRVILDRADQSGQMTSKQHERYRELLRRLKEALPMIDELGFSRPPVSLDVAA